MKRAFIFPGQGSQFIGMGKEASEHYPSARRVFEEVDEALGEKLSALIFTGEAEELTLTRNAQPALMATSMAVLTGMQEEGVSVQDHAHFVAGHSLGEYSALCAAGAITLGDTARLLRLRGEAMQDAVPVGQGAMAALLGLDFERASAIAKEAATGEICQAANDNDPGQVVISGQKEAVERACALAREAGAKRAIILPVSAPFHSELMAPAAAKMAQALDDVEINAPKVPLVANVTADEVSDPGTIRSLLVEQVTGSVRWRESVLHMAREGVGEAYEIGAGKALSGMLKRTAREIATSAVGSVDEIKSAAEKILQG